MIKLKTAILCLSFGGSISLKIDNLGYAFFTFFSNIFYIYIHKARLMLYLSPLK